MSPQRPSFPATPWNLRQHERTHTHAAIVPRIVGPGCRHISRTALPPRNALESEAARAHAYARSDCSPHRWPWADEHTLRDSATGRNLAGPPSRTTPQQRLWPSPPRTLLLKQ